MHFFTLVLVAWTFATTACATEPHFAALDVYGSERLSPDELRRNFGPEIDACIDRRLRQDPGFVACASDLGLRVKERFDLAYASFTGISYQVGDGWPTYFTVDVVESGDASRRLSFLDQPRMELPDPAGLIAAWDAYMERGWELVRRGELSTVRVSCRALHCIFGHDHPDLVSFGEQFRRGVAEHRGELEAVFATSRDGRFRANAAFLLAYQDDVARLVSVLRTRVLDPDPAVRNNVVRVFSDLAMFSPGAELPVEDVLRVLDFPETTDRNKAAAMLAMVLNRPTGLDRWRATVVQEGGEILVKMLRLQQPNNHDWAHRILVLLAGQDLGARDYEAWERWLSSASRPGVGRQER